MLKAKMKLLAVMCARFSELKCNFLVARCQKRDIVDTFSHASCANGHICYIQTGFPTTWRKAERAKLKVIFNGQFWLFSSVGTRLVRLWRIASVLKSEWLRLQ